MLLSDDIDHKKYGMDYWWGDSFFNRYKSSLGYSSSTLYNSASVSYKSYKSSYTNPEDRDQVTKLLTSAYKSVREFVVILDFPFKVDICFSGKSFLSRHKSDAMRLIFLPTVCLDDKSISDSKKIDILCGIGIHEAAHLKYSEVRVFNKFMGYIKEKEKHPKIIQTLIDLLEDERVEDSLLKERPGYLTYISTQKDWNFDYYKISSLTDPFASNKYIFNMIIRFIRYKNKIQEKDIPENYRDLFSEIGELIYPIYNNPSIRTKEVCKIGENLFKLIISTISFSESELNSIETVDYCSNIFSGCDTENREISLKDLNTTSLVEDSWIRVMENVANGVSLLGENNDIIFNKIITNEEDIRKYEEIAESVSKYVPSIKGLLVSQAKDYDFTIHGCRSGILDTNKLVEAYQGVPQVYKRVGHVSTSHLSVCILVDESGSMYYEKNYITARNTAILLNEALSSVPGINLFIYGHTADMMCDPYGYNREVEGVVSINIYREPGMKKTDYCGLSKIYHAYENRDGSAILNVAKRVRTFTKDHCIMFVISDGVPCAANYSGREAIKDTQSKIKRAESTLDVDVIGILINNYRSASDIYSSHIDLSSDLSIFPRELGKIIRTKILNTRVTTTS